MYLGRESMNTKGVPVHVMPRMEQMLRTNAPWSQLVELNNIDLKKLSPRASIQLTDEVSVTPFTVPHRDEFSETVGYTISTKTRSMMYIPDIDKWEKWETKLPEALKLVDYALIDGTFYKDGEISRPMSEVPHPFISETIVLLNKLPLRERRKVYFIHFNHSNPIVQQHKRSVSDVRKAGFGIAKTGLRLDL
jgi:pyrroloquinoline quinone biosynthesis protein B